MKADKNLEQRLEQLGEVVRGEQSVADEVMRTIGSKQQPSVSASENIWRVIMTSKITRYAAVIAFILIISGVLGIINFGGNDGGEVSPGGGFNLLAKVCAAEVDLFSRAGIIHIVNEIIVFGEDEQQEIVRNRTKTGIQELDDLYEEGSKWLEFQWLPMCSIKPDGGLRFNQLQLDRKQESYVVSDECWFDGGSGNFAHVLKDDDAVYFANSYDGERVYSSVDSEGRFEVKGSPVLDDFVAPRDISEILGVSAGLQICNDENFNSPIQEVVDEVLEDGTEVKSFKTGFKDFDGKLNAYWIFRVRSDDNTIAEMEFVIGGVSQLLIRRAVYEELAGADVDWSLSDLKGCSDNNVEQPKVKISPDMVIEDVTVEHMAERASYQTYIFSDIPSWCKDRVIVDCIDPPSPGERVFFVACKANDGRHLVFVQSATYNRMMGAIAKIAKLVYESENGFKVYSGGFQEKWWTEIVINSAKSMIGDNPASNRCGYLLESPGGTYPCIAINGPISEGELKEIVDSLVASEEYEE